MSAKKPYNFLAIKALQKYAEFGLWNDDLSTLVWYDDEAVVPRPTDEEILSKAAELRAADEGVGGINYKQERAWQYPPLTDFADALYWAQKGDRSKMDAWIAACDEVKAKVPKGAA